MLYKKKGLPEESEIVMCTVTNIQYSSVFVNIDDFNCSGMIHISEIAAGRIRNIRDYVKEGKKVVCKVLRVNQEKGHVDLSLRRVNERERRNKVNDVKFEQKAESIVEHVAKACNIPVQKLYDDLASKMLKNYAYLHHAFEDVVAGHLVLSSLNLDLKVAAQIEELANQRFKPQSVEITGVLELSSYESDGIDKIKEALLSAKKVSDGEIKYLGGGRYNLAIKAPDYKEAEPRLKKAVDTAVEFMHSNKGIAEFKRNDKKSKSS